MDVNAILQGSGKSKANANCIWAENMAASMDCKPLRSPSWQQVLMGLSEMRNEPAAQTRVYCFYPCLRCGLGFLHKIPCLRCGLGYFSASTEVTWKIGPRPSSGLKRPCSL
jgi:hypothetical protein